MTIFCYLLRGEEIISQLEEYFGEEENGVAVPCSAWFRYVWRVRAWQCACPEPLLRLLGYVVVGEINTLQPTASFSKDRLS